MPRTFVRAACLVAWALAALTALALPATGQTPYEFDLERFTEDMDEQRFSREETLEILTLNGIDERIATQYLDRFEEGRTFSEAEVDVMIRLMAPGVPEEEVEEAEEERVEGEPREAVLLFPEIIYPTELEKKIIKPFGYDFFRKLPMPEMPVEDITVGPEYVVGIGDQILITLWGDVDKRYVRVIDRQGRLVLPDIGVVTAAGKSLGELRTELEALFSGVYRGSRMTVSLGDVRTIQVYVSGDVHRPGNYRMSALSTILTALYHAGGPTKSGSLRQIVLNRRGQEPRVIDLYDFLLSGDRDTDLPLQSGDVVHVESLGPTVRVTGEVRRQAIYELKPGETLRSMIRYAGGLTEVALENRISVDRYSKVEGDQLYRIDWNDPVQDLTLLGGDEVTVYSLYHVNPQQFVEIYGRVHEPGIFRLVPGMRVADLVFRAGGLMEGAYRERGELSRLIEGVGDSLTRTELHPIPLQAILDDPDHSENLYLEKGDKVFVRTMPGWQPSPVVTVEGEVRFPGKYGLRSLAERIGDVMDRAGGATGEAFLKGAQLHRFEEGRIIIDFSKALEDADSPDNIEMADGDSIFVPRLPETIQVSGGVANPGQLLFVPGRKYSYYIENTGGFTENADQGRVKIQRVTGEVISAKRALWPDPEVRRGDELVVMMREEKRPVDWGRRLRDATTIIASLATTVYIISNIKD